MRRYRVRYRRVCPDGSTNVVSGVLHTNIIRWLVKNHRAGKIKIDFLRKSQEPPHIAIMNWSVR